MHGFMDVFEKLKTTCILDEALCIFVVMHGMKIKVA